MSENEWLACMTTFRMARTKLRARKVVMVGMSGEPASGYARRRLYSG